MQHGVIGYTQWMATLGRVVNMMMWVDVSWGRRIDLDPVGFHPAPNLWERLNTAGVRTVVYQPHAVLDTPLSNMLYRGAERYGYSSVSEVHPSLLFDAGGRTLAVVYTSRVDSAAHLAGQRSQSYSRALAETGGIWERFARTLPSDTVLVRSADHGHCDIHPDGKIYLDRDLTDGMRCWGDGRVLMFLGPLRRARRIARLTGARLVDTKQLQQWLGQGPPHPALPELPNAALLAPEGTVILPHYMPSHQVGHHGGITPQELRIPLLVAETPAPS